MNQVVKVLNLTHYNYADWRDAMDDYLESQGWEKFIKHETPAGASDKKKAKISRIALAHKIAVVIKELIC